MGLALASRVRPLSVSPVSRHERLKEVLPPLESFAKRHIGPSQSETDEMLAACGVKVSVCLCICFLAFVYAFCFCGCVVKACLLNI